MFIYANKLKVSFLAYKCVFYRPEHNSVSWNINFGKLVTVWAKSLSVSEISYLVLSKNAIL